MALDLGEIDLLGDTIVESPQRSTALPEVKEKPHETPQEKPPRSAAKTRSPCASAMAKGLFFFDLETIPDYSRMAQFGFEPIPIVPPIDGPESLMPPPEFVTQNVKEMKAWLDKHNPPQDWIDQAIAAEKALEKPRKGSFEAFEEHTKRIATVTGAKDARRKDMALSPEMNRIVAMGWAFGDEEPQSMVVCGENTEVQILEEFWGMAKRAAKTIGFNILGFDLPTIFVRSMLLDVAPTRLFDLKPWGNDCIDLMSLRFPKGPAKGLKWISGAMGIEVQAGDVDGSQVHALYEAKNFVAIGKYVRSDVRLIQELHGMYRGYFCH